MKKLFVEDVKVGVSEGGMACGPVSGSVVAEVRLRDPEDSIVKYYSLAEVEGIPNFFETDESTYDRQIEEVDDVEFWNMLSEHAASDFCGYADFFENQEEMERNDPDSLLIWKYLIYMVRADWDEIEQMKTKSVGKCLGDFEIPVSDVEQDYLDEIDEEESDEEEIDADESDMDDSEDLESLMAKLNIEFCGKHIETGYPYDLGEDESSSGRYSSHVGFRNGQNDYRLQYGIWVDDNLECTGLDLPICEKLVGEKYVPCPDGEVSANLIYTVLAEELNTWL